MKYFESLGLIKDPFAATPDPDFFFPTRDYAGCVQRLELSLQTRGGMNVILGDSGVGKTSLAQVLVERFHARRESLIVRMLSRPDRKSEFKLLEEVCGTFDIGTKCRSRREYRNAIHDFAFRRVIEEGKVLLLIIDDGHNLSSGNLEVLRKLLDCQFDGAGLLNLVVLGRMELFEKIRGSESPGTGVDLLYTINPLDPDDLKEYILHRLKRAGCENVETLFDDMAINEIWCFSKGNPLKANAMCYHSLISMNERDSDIVSQETVRSVARNWKIQW